MKSTKTISITKRDFDKAVKQPWSTGTCVIAQAALRQNIVYLGEPDVWNIVEDTTANQLMNDFDDSYHWNPNKRKLNRIRASLPIKVTLS